MTHNFSSNLTNNLNNFGVRNNTSIILECLYKLEEVNLKGSQQPRPPSPSL
jgi:hypothetical protein